MNAVTPFRLDFERPTLYPKQKAAIYDRHRFSLIEASTKAGKTSGCISWLLEQAMGAQQPGWNYWWVAPVSEQALIAFRRMQRALPREVFSVQLSLKTITLVNGAIIWFKSADKPDSLYGEDVHAAVLDEASRMKENSYTAVRTTLTHTKGMVRIIGNVRGRKNWFFQMARRAQVETEARMEPRELSYHKIVAGDAVAAGVLDAKEIEDARSQLTETAWRELYLAEASDDGGNPFGEQHIRACVVPAISDGQPVVWGWDFAKKRDFTVGIALDARGHVCRFERFHGVPWGETVNKVVALVGATAGMGDSTGVGDAIVEDIQRKLGGEPGFDGNSFTGYVYTAGSKQRLMEGLALAIQSRSVFYPEGPIKTELDQFEYVFTPTGVRYNAPEGMFDDCVNALALAVMCRHVVPPPMTEIRSRELLTQLKTRGIPRYQVNRLPR